MPHRQEPYKSPRLVHGVPTVEWLTERDQQRHAENVSMMRHMRAGVAIVVLVVLALALWGYAMNATTIGDLHRLQDQAKVACGVRNTTLEEQKRVYQEFIATERIDDDQDPAIQRAKIVTYQNALDALPDPVDCSKYER